MAAVDAAGAHRHINTDSEYGVPGVGNKERFAYTGQMFLLQTKRLPKKGGI